MCLEDEQLKEGREKILLKFLHDLGIVLNFQDDPRLSDTNILNPEWVTEGVYKIINKASSATLDLGELKSILDCAEYPADKRFFIIDMMKKFELCFELDGYQGNKFLIPDLLPKEEPLYEWNEENNLRFQYHYTKNNFFPPSVISRFIVRMHSLIFDNIYWRNGVILSNGKNRALVKADVYDKKIFIYIDGEQNTKRDLLSIIRSHFEHIHKTIAKVDAEEKVALDGKSEILVNYEYLLKLEKLNQDTFMPDGDIEEPVSVRELLNGVDSKERQQTQKTETEHLERRLEELNIPYEALNEKIRKLYKELAKETEVFLRGGFKARIEDQEAEREEIYQKILLIEGELNKRKKKH